MTAPTTAHAGTVRIGIADADAAFVEVVGARLNRLGREHVAVGAAVAVERLASLRLTALVLDPASPAGDAWSCLEQVTSELPALPVVVCTDASTVSERVRGLRMGADDWVTKPCHPDELIARVDAASRRCRRRPADAPARGEVVVAGEVEIRRDRFQAFADGRSLRLTRKEFELIELLAAANGRVLERAAVYERVWGFTLARGDRSVDVLVRKLRAKLRSASPDWAYIHTHFGVGYRFAAERTAAEPATDEPAPGPADVGAAHAPVGADG